MWGDEWFKLLCSGNEDNIKKCFLKMPTVAQGACASISWQELAAYCGAQLRLYFTIVSSFALPLHVTGLLYFPLSLITGFVAQIIFQTALVRLVIFSCIVVPRVLSCFVLWYMVVWYLSGYEFPP